MNMKEQIESYLPDSWQLLNVIKVPFGTTELGTHEGVFYNKNLDLEARIYFNFSNGIVRKIASLPKVLTMATEGKCEEFVEALG